MSKQLLRVEESLVRKMQMLDEVEEISEYRIKELSKEFLEHIELIDENIDSNVLDLRLKAQRVRDTYRKVVDEEIQATDKLWEELDAKRYESGKRFAEVKRGIEVITKDVENVQKMISGVNLYGIDKLIETINKIESLSPNQLDLLGNLFKTHTSY